MSDRRDLPIAVFDSGVGGLTVLHEFLVSLPEEDYLYLGDSARFPYGTRSEADLRECVARNTAFLLERGTKLIVIACNSASAAGARDGAGACGGARRRGDRGDRAGGRDRRRDHRRPAGSACWRPRRRSTAAPTAGRWSSGAAGLRITAGRLGRPRPDHPERLPLRRGRDADRSRLLRAALKADVDTVILGCTHYPLVAPMLQRILGRDVRLVIGGARARRERPAGARGPGPGGRRRPRGHVQLPLHRRRRARSASSAPGSCRCRWARSSTSICPTERAVRPQPA